MHIIDPRNSIYKGKDWTPMGSGNYILENPQTPFASYRSRRNKITGNEVKLPGAGTVKYDN